MKTALVDIDSILFAAGSLAETVYHVVDGIRFNYKSEANEFCDLHNIDRSSIEREVDAQPASHAINILKTTVQAAVREAGCIEYEAYLSPTDKSNFRFAVDPEYKANRKDLVKPVHFKALREYAIRYMGVQVVSGMEADDILSIRAHELGFENAVIITIDKDMRQVPCWHYNWQKKGPVEKVSEHEARVNFYTQLLTGDSIDNIKGCPGIGPAKARKILAGLKDEADMMAACLQAFVTAYDGDEDEAKAQLRLNASLVHLLWKRP